MTLSEVKQNKTTSLRKLECFLVLKLQSFRKFLYYLVLYVLIKHKAGK